MDVAKSDMAGSAGEFGWDGKFYTYFWIDPVRELYGLLMFQLDMEGRHSSHNHFKQLIYQALLDTFLANLLQIASNTPNQQYA